MSSEHEIKMWTPTTLILLLFIIIGTAMAVYRLSQGLGASTNMNDMYPWGIWLGFDVLGGVAMAAGGFIIQQAGGKNCDFYGKEDWLFGGTIIATNEAVSDEFRDIMKKIFIDDQAGK